ncbi:MAG: hypothetical protein AAB417_02415 [Patescibacteria group bacterium]
MKKILLALMLALPLVAGAHGGEQRVVDGTYIVSMSRAPFTPRMGVPTKLLISISDIASGNVSDKDAIINLRVARLASPGDEPQFIFEEKNIKAERSTLGYSYTFREVGFHEIYIDFAFVDSPTKVMSASDYLLDVQPAQEAGGDKSFALWGFGGLFLGAIFTKIVLARKGEI